MDFNGVSPTLLLELIEGLVYERVNLSAVNEEYGENFVRLIEHFRDHKLEIYIYGHMLDRETLLSLREGTNVQIVEETRYDGKQRDESEQIPEPEWRVDDDLLIQLTRKKFKMLRIPVDLHSEETIVEVMKIISSSDSAQRVNIKIPETSMDRFLSIIGMRREGRIFYRNVGCKFQLKLAEKLPLTHTIIYKNSTAKAHYRMEENQTVICLAIENTLYSSTYQLE